MRALVAASILLWLSLAAPATAKTPVLVELFTSQGCAACAGANAYAAALASREDVLPLTFSVGYWDYLGWRDTFAKTEFAERQKAYARRLTTRAVSTPQIVVDGRAQASGAHTGPVERLIDQARTAARRPPQMRFVGHGRVDVGSGEAPKAGAEVWLVRYDPRGREVEVRGGQNRGRVIAYRNVVSELVRLGAWSGRPKAFRLPPAKVDGLKTAVVVQQSGGGRVLALLTD
jgi:hypothetical protein